MRMSCGMARGPRPPIHARPLVLTNGLNGTAKLFYFQTLHFKILPLNIALFDDLSIVLEGKFR